MVKAAFGKRIVTPPVGSGLVGYFEKRIAKGVKDDLYVRSICLDCEDNPVFVVSADFCWIEESVLERVKNMVEKKLGINNPGVVIHATHTHTGPLTGLTKDLVFTKDLPIDRQYIDKLPSMISEAIEDSYRTARNVLIGFKSVEVSGISFLRRYRMKDGSVITNPVDRANIVEPVGEIDRTLNIMKILDENGKLFCIAINFALHPDTIGGELISGDWPGMVVERISKFFDCNAIFFNGASGDINHINPFDSETRSQKITEKIVSTIFEAVKKNVEDIECGSIEKVVFSQDIVEMPKRVITTEQIKQAKNDLQKLPSTNLRAIVARALLNQYEMKTEFISNRVTLLTIDNRFGAFFISGEPFSSIGIAIKKLMGFENRWVIGNCDGHAGYIPDEKAFRDAEENKRIKGEEFPSVDVSESIGMEASYETSPISCMVSSEAEKAIISGFEKLLKKHLQSFVGK
ncbi:MAG: neutral/alkaline non-lysosomal ceramidase N-terminal domain-containing protein [Candidatus Omnitrophica bacterium]|nr:neutral/alkaline non-lysosomal ceramidase N-terminal domain-containing protein [Candidatus Omnitrophota bacterium]